MTFGNFHWLDLTKYAVTLLPQITERVDIELFHTIPVMTSDFKVVLNASFYSMSKNLPFLY